MTFGRKNGDMDTVLQYHGGYNINVADIKDEGMAVLYLAWTAVSDKKAHEVAQLMVPTRFPDLEPNEQIVNLVGAMTKVYRLWGIPSQSGPVSTVIASVKNWI